MPTGLKALIPSPLKPPLRATRAFARELQSAVRLRALERTLRCDWGDGLVLDIHPADEMWRYCSGTPSEARRAYFTTALDNLREISSILEAQSVTFPTAGRILDFAGGYGRLTRFLVQQAPGRVTHSDIAAEAVCWVAERIGAPSFASVAHPAALLHEGRYDLILAISLFSHLPIGTWAAWLEALTGLLALDGRLIFTTHGLGLLPESAEGACEEEPGFVFLPTNETQGRLPEAQYGSTFVSPAWVALQTGGLIGATLVGTYPRSLWGRQDAYVVKREESAQHQLGTWQAGQV